MAPLLVEGVLFDCLGRLEGVNTLVLKLEESQPVFADLAAARPARAARAFDAALKIDPHLIEARLRVSRIRAMSDPHAMVALENIARDEAASPFGYLAAMSRAFAAQTQHDAAVAIRWYERSLELNPRSTAAAFALSALKPASALSFEALDAHDLYYDYPCRILTPGVGAAVSTRMTNVVVK